MNLQQRDFLIEAEDKLRIGDNKELQAIVERLPQNPLLNVFEVTGPLAVSENTVYNWITSGRFSVLNAGTRGQPRYKIFRYSLVDFLKSRVVAGGAAALK